MEKQNPKVAKSFQYNIGNPQSVTIPDIKLYYRTVVIKTALYCQKIRQVNVWNLMEDPDLNPHSY